MRSMEKNDKTNTVTGMALTYWLKKAGIKQVELSEMTGISQPHISAMSRGHKNINAENLEKICEALEISIPDFFTFDGPEPLDLPASNPPPDNDVLRAAISRIQELEQRLDEKDRQLGELAQYKHRWEGLLEIKRTEETVRVQAQQQKNLLYASDPSACAGREPESRELSRPGGIGPPEYDGSVGDGI